MISNVHFQKTSFFFGFFEKHYTFYTKNLIFYNDRCPKCRKNQLFSNMFTFLSVIRQNFEYNLRILANIRVKTQNLRILPIPFKKTTVFFGFFNKDYTFYIKNLFITMQDAQSFIKISLLVTCFTLLSVICQNFEYNLRILAYFLVKT